MLAVFALAISFFSAQGQSYNLNYAANAGNPPGGLVTTDLLTSGTIILGSSTMSANQWSANQSLSFPFIFYGVPVTQFKVSANGVLTFDVATAILPGANVAVPTPTLPDLSIAFMWDEFTDAPPTGSGDYCRTVTLGTAPNRQQWIWYYSYEVGTPNYSYAYWAVVLEETSNNIYVVDQYSSAGTSGTTVGVQLNATTGIQDSNSPNITRPGNGTGLADNDLWTFQYLTAPCAGSPAVGTVAGLDSACQGISFILSVTGTTPAVGLAYQWQSSPDGFVWTDIAGATGTAYTGSVGATATNYRRRDICTNTLDTSYTNAHLVNPISFLNCYCTSNATSTVDEDILNVTFAGINNTSTNNCQTYSDYTGITGLALMGLTYPISVNTGDCEGVNFYNRKVVVFVDWNHDGDFTDADERIFEPAYQPGQLTVLFSGSATIPLTAQPGVTRMRVVCVETTGAVNPCGTYTWGETEDYYLNVLPPPTDEAGVLAITQPEVAACTLGDKIWVNMQNLGSNDLTTANFTVKINNINIPVANPWTGNVPAQSTAEIQIPVTYALSDGDSVWVEVSLPNGQVEDALLGFNNVVSRRVYVGLSGVKMVSGATPDFVDMNAAISALQQRGVCDTVFFHIASGPYTTQHVLTEYPGAGPGRLAVFESASGNPADVAFTFSGTATTDNFVFRFDGADGYMLRNLSARNAGAAFSTVIDIKNGSDHLTFENNVLTGDTAAAYSTSDFNRIVVASVNATNDNDIVLRNNHILGGNRGVNLGGANGNYETGIVLDGNTIESYSYIGVIFGNLSGYTAKNNVFRPRPNLTQEVFGIYANGTIDGALLDGNDIMGNRPGSGIFLTNVKGTLSETKVTNNFIYQGDTTATGVSRGILVQDVNSTGVLVANNSIALYGNNANTGAFTVLDGSQIRYFNNNIGAFGNASAVRVEKPYSITAADNNNLFGANLANMTGSLYTTLAALQAGTGRDMNSVSVNPGFNGTDLHTCAPELNAAGMPLALVTADFDGESRSATPDIGADEFLGDANGLLAEDAFLKCPADQVTIGNPPMNGVTYSWTPSGGTSQITTAAAGPHVVTATGSCGSFSDTAMVTNKPMPVAGFTMVSVGLTAIFTNTSTNGTSYLWDFGDGTTSTDFSPSHVYGTAGTYSATLTVTNDCGSVTFGPLPVNVINAGVDEVGEGIQVSLYPNPTGGQFTLALGNTVGEAVTVSVIDVTGKAVMQKNFLAGTQQITLDATSFASGIYSVKISGADWSRVVRLVRK